MINKLTKSLNLAIIGLLLLLIIPVVNAQNYELRKENLPLHEWIDVGNSANGLICGTIGDPLGIGIFSCGDIKPSMVMVVIKVFNVLVLMAASVYFGWSMLAKSISAASEGEWLGKKTHNAWLPARMLVGSSLIVPIFNGFSFAQLLVITATAVGIGSAGMAVQGAEYIFPGINQKVVMPVDLPRFNDVLADIEENLNCVAGLSKKAILNNQAAKNQKRVDDVYSREVQGDSGVSNGINTNTPDVYLVAESRLVFGATTTQVNSQIMDVEFGALSPDPSLNQEDWGRAACGIHTQMFANVNKEDISIDTDNSDISAMLINFRRNFFRLYSRTIKDLSRNAMNLGRAEALGRDYDYLKVIEYYQENFDKQVEAYARNAVNSVNRQPLDKSSIMKGLRFGEWLGLGFEGLAQIPNTIKSTKGSTAKTKKTEQTTSVKSKIKKFITFGLKLAPSVQTLKKTAEAIADIQAGGIDGFVNRPIARKVNLLGQKVGGSIKSASDNPITALSNLGLVIFYWGGGAMALLLGIGFVAALVPTLTLSTVVLQVTLFFIMILLPLFFFAFRAIVYIPYIIALSWLTALLNWVAMVFEGFFAAPLWAMLHLNTDGEGIAEQPGAKRGWVFLAGLMFMPMMMVGTYFFIQGLLNVIWALFKDTVANNILSLEYGATGTEWLVPLLMILGAVFICITVAELVVTSCAQLLHAVPKAVISWIDVTYNPGVSPSEMIRADAGLTKASGQIEGRAGAGVQAMLTGRNLRPQKSQGANIAPTSPENPKNAIK